MRMADSYFDVLSQAPPGVQLDHLISGGWIAQAIGVAAELGIADLVADGPRPSDELAAATRSHPRALYRLLRMLASVGIFSERAMGQFQLTPMAELLGTDPGHPYRCLAVHRRGRARLGDRGRMTFDDIRR
jgi:DNA-binding IclR family transcriptional regulator